jgi:indole-3-glycerol phosphate synthase
LTSSFLSSVIARKREEVAARSRKVSLALLKDKAGEIPRVAGRIQSAILAGAPGLKVIAEFKRKSPSGGSLNPAGKPEDYARTYAQSGASAMSVLCDKEGFDGSLEDALAASKAVSIPILRKDFIVDSYQVYETAAAGIPSLLLILAALEDREYQDLLGLCQELKIEALVEITNELEMERAGDVPLLGVNNRNLHTLKTDRRRALDLMGRAPPGALVVAESGISTLEQAQEAFSAGADAALIGEALMRADDPGALIREIRENIR